MLDHISISHQSGLVLWSRAFTPTFETLANTPNSPINALIKSTFIEGKAMANGEEQGLEKDGYSVRWSVDNGLGLVFVVVFPALLPLTYVPALLERTKALFLALFQPYVTSLIESLSSGGASAGSALKQLKEKIVEERWDEVWDRCFRNCEGEKKSRSTLVKQRVSDGANPAISSADTSDVDVGSQPAVSAEEIAKNVQSLKAKMKGGKRRGVRDGLSPSPSPSPSRKPPVNATSKLMRRWGDSPVTADDMAALDYSTPAPDSSANDTVSVDKESLVSSEALGTRNETGAYQVADWDFRRAPVTSQENLPSEEEIIARGTSRLSLNRATDDGSSQSSWTSMFSRLTGSKILTRNDLAPVLVEMEKHLMSKNVAKDIAEKLCDSVGAALVGKKLGGLSSVKSEVQSVLSTSLTRVLTPKTSTDILLEIQRKRSSHLATLSATSSSLDSGPDPYTMTFVGVNGVGKSTNLSKVCFWLLQNGLRVLIAACDTFRSGAVEQLRVHVRNLGALGEEMGQGKGKRIELFERGYGKDAAGIAKDAITYAKEHAFDVVLIDTAGRMQDNEPLMRALAKLVTVNNPDKIVFVGEALVGNEAVDQLTKFDRALRDFSGAGVGGVARKRGIDGIILTKFDTIDDKVGAALSMTYITGQPILFVGCGQTYTDLRQLRVNHIVQALLS
ncbi:signal recognition particle receptor subunit alpha [Cryptococcus neoformans var. grubii Br795]|nr:signal recognition particle receptor subunit alpha [Cryptococcus neoformans var. grubii Br795]